MQMGIFKISMMRSKTNLLLICHYLTIFECIHAPPFTNIASAYETSENNFGIKSKYTKYIKGNIVDQEDTYQEDIHA